MESISSINQLRQKDIVKWRNIFIDIGSSAYDWQAGLYLIHFEFLSTSTEGGRETFLCGTHFKPGPLTLSSIGPRDNPWRSVVDSDFIGTVVESISHVHPELSYTLAECATVLLRAWCCSGWLR